MRGLSKREVTLYKVSLLIRCIIALGLCYMINAFIVMYVVIGYGFVFWNPERISK